MEMDIKTISDQTNIPGHFSAESFQVFIDAFSRYRECLEPFAGEGNETINKEIKKIDTLIRYFRDRKNEAEYGFASINLLFENWALLTDVLFKYHAIKHSEYNDKKRATLMEAALEGEKTKLEKIDEVVKIKIFQDIDACGRRKRTLVPDFYLHTTSIKPPKNADPTIQQQITIENMYAPAVFGVNNGQVTQNNNSELVKILFEFSKQLAESKDVPEEIKSNALGDIQTIQSQVMKKSPDKNIIEKALDSLQVLSNAATVMSFAPTAIHYMQKLQNLLQNIKI